MSLTQKDRKFRAKSGIGFQNGGEPPNFTADISSLLKRSYGGRHSAVKIVAAAVGANERAVKNWFDGKNAPNGEHLLRLMNHSDAMLVGFLAMAGKQGMVVSLELDRVASAMETALIEIRRFRSS